MAKLTLFVICFIAALLILIVDGKHHHRNGKKRMKDKRSFRLKPKGEKLLHKTIIKTVIKKRDENVGFSDAQDATAFGETASNEDYPILWDGDDTQHLKKKQESSEEELPQGGPHESQQEMPNTVSPNPNIFGGFPENDIWGNFELPAPATIDHLKMALKMNHHRPNYGSDQGVDSSDLLYGYEHHAMPEYDVLETPPFQAVLWQNAQLQQSLKGGGKPGGCAPGMGSCPPINSEAMCNNLHQACVANAQHPTDGKVDYEQPCAQKILELFGCGKAPEEPKPKPKPKEKEKPKPKPIPPKKKKPKDEKPPEPSKPPKPPRLGEKLTSEDSGSKLNENELLEILTKAHKEKSASQLRGGESPYTQQSEQNNIENSDARQSFHKNEHSKFEDGNRVGLINSEESLALMTAIGNDLEKSLTSKFKGDDSFDDHTQDMKMTPDNNFKKPTTSEDKLTLDLTASKSVEKTDADQTQLTSNFVPDSKKLSEDLDFVSHGGERFFSDWSSWTRCKNSCVKSTISRRRNCLKTVCNGALVQRQHCPIVSNWCKSQSNSKAMSTEDVESSIRQNDFPVEDTFKQVVSKFANDISNTTEQQSNTDDDESDASIIANLLHDKLEKAKEKELSAVEDGSTAPVTVQPEPNESDQKQTAVDSFSSDSSLSKSPISANATPFKLEKQTIVSKSTGTWGDWSECSTSCGLGVKSRALECDNGNCDNTEEKTQEKPCRKMACQDKQTEDLIQQNCLSLHNELRHRHGAGSLQWSNDLYRKALEISDRIALKNIPPSNLSRYERPGLNLGVVELTEAQNNRTETTPCKKAIESWYGQKLNYNYEKPSLFTGDRDFTQLVWKATNLIGISKSVTLDGKYAYVAAVYAPPGNTDSYYDMKKNALPAQSEEDKKTMDFLDELLVNKKRSKFVIKN